MPLSVETIGSVNLRYYFFIMLINKQLEPLFYMIKFTLVLFARKAIIKIFSSILYVLYCPFNYAFLKRRVKMMV